MNGIADNLRTLNDVSRRSDTFQKAGINHLSMTHSPSKVSIQDMINSTRKTNDSFGIDGMFAFPDPV